MNCTVYNEKNKTKLIIIAILLLIPTLLAIHFSLTGRGTVAVKTEISSVEIVSPAGDSSGLTDADNTALFAEIIGSSKEINGEYRDLSAETPYTVKVNSTDGTASDYSFYMINAADGCIFTDSEGKHFLVNEKHGLKLLSLSQFGAVNTYSVVPDAIITRNGKTLNISPSGGSWSYIEADKSYSTKEVASSAEIPTAKISIASVGELSFDGNRAPDNVTVVLSKDGTTVHEGAFDTLLNANVMTPGDTYYDMTVTADWAQTEGCNEYGTVNYTLKVLYDVAPTYALLSTSIPRGDFTVIKMTNFNAGEKLYVQSDYEFPKALDVFEMGGGMSFAFLPTEYSSATGSYNVTLSVEDGSSQTVKVSVGQGKTPTVTAQEMLVSDEALQAAFTADAIEQFNKTVAEKTAVSTPSALWNGKFVYPDKDNKGAIGAGMAHYGTTRTVRGLHQLTYVHTGMDIAIAEGGNVVASNAGKVVFAGNLTLTGNTVIIDHGCSIFTYYGHLASISVAEGDSVTKSSVIGTAGKTGFAAAVDGAGCKPVSQVHFAASVEGAFVNPYYLYRYGVAFGD